MERREARADRWSEGARARMLTVEPEWWLRMLCGQLAQEDPAAEYAGMGHALRHVGKKFLSVVGRNSRRIS